MESKSQLDSMLTVRDVAYILHVHPNTVRRWCDRGNLKAYRIVKRGDRRFKREDVNVFLDSLNMQEYNMPTGLVRK